MRHFLLTCIPATFLILSSTPAPASDSHDSTRDQDKLAAMAEERTDWAAIFDQFEADGTIVVVDGRSSNTRVWVHDPERARQRFSPASTYKIPHTLIALDTGVVRDEFEIFRWDGVERPFSGHNRDQDLRSAMRHSALWVYQKFAQAIEEETLRNHLDAMQYGNADVTAEDGDYWVNGDLAISAHEQIIFLKRLFRNELNVAVEHQRLVKDLMIGQAGQDWILRAKTGWQGPMGWWVGWIEWSTGPVFFALNIDTPNRMEDLSKRQKITRSVLDSIEALP